MTCPAVIEVITPGPPGPPGDGSTTITGPAVLGRAEATAGFAVALPLGTGLSIVGGALTATGATNLSYEPATRLLSSSTGEDVTLPLVTTTAAGLIPHTWLTGTEAAIFPHIHGALAGVVYEHVRAGTSLSALTPYRITEAAGDTDRVVIAAADAGSSAMMPASGLLIEALANNADGHGAVAGVVTGVNTAAYQSGTVLYVAAGGGLTATPPATNVQAIAVVGRQHANTGTLSMLQGPSLPRVAYTGDYEDLLNPPSIPAPANQAPAALGTAAIGASTEYAREDHVHQMPTAGDVGADPAGTAASAVSAHVAASDPHTQYLRSTEVVAGTNVTIDTTTTPGSVIINSTAPGGGSPGGSSGQAQFNNDGAFGGAAGLTIDPTTGRLTLASFLAAASAPATPASAGFALYAAPTTGALSWKGANGFVRSLNATGITADRTYQLQDRSGTVAHLDDVFDGYGVNNYVMPINAPLAAGTQGSANIIYLQPFAVQRSLTISEIAVRISNSVAASVFQLAIYDTADRLPATLLGATADVTGSTATAVSSSVNEITLLAGRVYWFAVNSNAGHGFVAVAASSSYSNSLIGASQLFAVISSTTVSQWNRIFSHTYGTWPDLTGQNTTLQAGSRCPAPIFRVSALL